MALSIKDEETDRLARAVSAATGKSITEAVREALQRRLDEVQGEDRRAALVKVMSDIGRETVAHMTAPFDSADHGCLLYDDDGLPR